jgi:hypothetical protein
MVVFMADVCDYIYVSGLRFKSGTPFIEIQSSFLDAVSKEPSKEPSKLVRLAVVRDGKGASRLDRWASKPARFGVVGEINLRDLSKVLDSSGMSDVDAMVSLSLDDSSDGGLISLVLDPTAAMGRRGRLLDSDMIDDALLSLPDTQCQALVKEQLRSMPYGVENTKAASIRLQVLLRHATPETIAEAVKESTDFIKHIDRETVALLSPIALNTITEGLLVSGNASLANDFAARSLEARFESSFQTLMSVPSQYFTMGDTTKDSQEFRLADLAALLHTADKNIAASLDQVWLLSVVTRLERESRKMHIVTKVRDMITNRDVALSHIALSTRFKVGTNRDTNIEDQAFIGRFSSDPLFTDKASKLLPNYTFGTTQTQAPSQV